MSLRSKTLLLFVCVFALYVGVNYGIQRWVVLPRFLSLEREQAAKDLARCVKALDGEIQHLDNFCSDWAAWDDTYAFARDRNPNYVETNLPDTTLTDTGIDLIYICDNNGKVVWGKILDPATGEPIEVPEFPSNALPGSHPLLTCKTGERPLAEAAIAGLFLTAKGPMLVASRPILTSLNAGPSRGSMIMGRFLDGRLTGVLAERTGVPFHITSVRRDIPSAEERNLLARLTRTQPVLFEADDPDLMNCYGTFDDVEGNEALLIHAEILRDVSAKGVVAMDYAMQSLLFAGILLMGVAYIGLHFGVVRPLSQLTRRVVAIEHGQETAAPACARRNDEIGKLAREFEHMLHTIEQRESALRESEDRFQKLLASIDDVVWSATVDGKMLYMNRAAERVYGRPARAFLEDDRLWLQCVHPEDRETVAGHIYELFEKRRIEREYRVVRPDGEVRWILDRQSLVDDAAGNPMAVAGLASDITERKRTQEAREHLEAQLRHSEKMRMIGTLAGGIAHDFNNILSPILAYTYVTMQALPEDSQARTDLSHVVKAANRAKELVEQILAFSRREEKAYQPVLVHFVVEEALKLIRPSLPATVEIREQIDHECDAVMANPTQIHQVIMNLATNAYHAMRESGGVLDVRLEAVEVDAELASQHENLHEGPYARITVSDTGHGIDRATMERLFEPFFTTKQVGEGAGLGLSVVHGIVQSHGGEIAVRSELGKGTTFQVYLPRVGLDAGEEALSDRPIPHGTERILFVDDEEEVALLGERLLEPLGYHLTSRTSSVEALETFRAAPDDFDLVVTDLIMPHMTGAHLAAALMEIRPDIPVIIMTGFGGGLTPEQAKQMGIRDYVMKPITAHDLGRSIRHALDDTPAEDSSHTERPSDGI